MADEIDISPRGNNYLLGQQTAENVFLQAWKNKTLHHAWILCGEKGIGKATLAYRLARFLLWADETDPTKYSSLNVPENSTVFKQIACGSHPDLLVLERDYIDTDRKKIIKAIQKGEALSESELAAMKKSAFIRVDDVRNVSEFLNKTSLNNSWRVVIIDSADDMNKSSANALLKILEEPPAHTIIFLISHNAGLLLPTIRSRCAKLPLHALKVEETASLLRRYRPELKEADVVKISRMCDGSIGKAVSYADFDAVNIYEDLCALFYARTNFSLSRLIDFSTMAAGDADKFSLTQDLIIRFIRENMTCCRNAEALYNCWNETNKMFSDCANINMDKRLMLINLIYKICRVL